MGQVNFWKGSYNDYLGMEKSDNILYFIMDEYKICLGEEEVSNNNSSEISIYEEDIVESEKSAVWKENN